MNKTPHEHHAQEQPRSRFTLASLFLPRRDKLHAPPRIAVAALGNCLLALYVLPHISMAQEIKSVPSMAATWAIQAALPLAILLILLPVFLFGRDLPRLIAIGLSVLPCYLAAVGIAAVFEALR